MTRQLAGGLGAVMLLLASLAPLRADIGSTATWRWVADAAVAASVSSDDTAYLGGAFRYIGAVTTDGPSFVEQESGVLAAGCATRTGTLDGIRPAVVPDPAGGVFMQVPLPPERLLDGAGDFTVPASESFVRIGADCRFDRAFHLEPFVPGDTQTRGLSVLRVGEVVYVSGSRFVGFDDQIARVTAFNGATGARIADREFTTYGALLLDGVAPDGQLIVSVTERGLSATSYRVGALNLSTGGFTQLTTVDAVSGFVKVHGATLYASAAPNAALQAIDLATGTPRAGWGTPAVSVTDVEVADGRLFVAGSGLGRTGVFAISEATGALVESFAPALHAGSGRTLSVERLALVGSRLFVRGRTVRALGDAERYLLAAVDTATGAADPWAPLVFAPTTVSVDLVPNGTRLYIGRVASSQLLRRTHLAAVNILTGAVLPFDPNGSGVVPQVPPITSLAVTDLHLFAGTSQGQVRRVSRANGLLDGWAVLTGVAGGAPGYVTSLVATPDLLYAGGFFTLVSTSSQPQAVARGHGVAVSSATAQLTTWDPQVVGVAAAPSAPRRPVEAMALSDTVMMLAGEFTAAGGQPRVGLAAVDATSGTAALPALTLPPGSVGLDLEQAGTRTFFVGVASDGVGLIGVANAAAGDLTSWNTPTPPPVRGPTSRLAYVDGIVYSGPAWNADTGTPTADSSSWTSPAASTDGLLELYDPLDGATGPVGVHFHAAGIPGSPTAPRNLAVRYAGTEVFLSWSAPARGDVESYVVRAGPVSGASNLFDFDTRSTATTLSGTAPEGVYYVRVHARGRSGLTGPSNEVVFALAPFGCNSVPGVPGMLAGAGAETTAAFAWGTAVGAMSYVVEAGSAPGRTDLVRLNVGRRVGLETSAPPGTYVVRVRGTNPCGEGPATNEVVVQVGGPPPDPPTNLQATVTGATVALRWNAPTTGTVPTFYQLEAGSRPEQADLALLMTTSREYTAAGVAAGTYYVRVRSGNAAGRSAASLDLMVVVPPQ